MNTLDWLAKSADVVNETGKVLENLPRTDEDRAEADAETGKAEREYDLQTAKMISDQNLAQADVDKTEAATGNWFMAGWRPAIGWIGALALAYQFLLYPLLTWLPLKKGPPPPLDYTMLYSLITGMLGIAGLRSFDKLKGTDTKSIGD